MGNIENKILRMEMYFPKCFSDCLEKDYGYIFYNDSNPTSHDSNHAIISDINGEGLYLILSEIKDFYISRGISPRIYQIIDGQFMKNKAYFKKAGYILESYGSGKNDVFVLEDESNYDTTVRLNIKRLEEIDDRILNLVESYDANVIKRGINNPDFVFFVGELNGKYISCASILYVNGIGRLDHVCTDIKYRKQGYCRELIKYIVEYHKEKHNDSVLYEWSINETAKKIYYDAGFRYKFSYENWVAYIDG